MAQVVAKTGFMTNYGGQEVHIVEGDVLDSKHEIVRSTPKEWWGPIVSRFGGGPEEAVSTKKRAAAKPKAADDAAED